MKISIRVGETRGANGVAFAPFVGACNAAFGAVARAPVQCRLEF